MALLAEEDGHCGGCGHPREESMDPRNQDAYRSRLLTCYACAEREKARQDLNEAPAEPGIQIVVERRP